jgi:predicted nucleotidyltransferase
VSVDPATTAAHVRALLNARACAASARAESALGIARHLARILRERWGASRVYLHGSLARGASHARSDIDLAVEGLPPARLLDAAMDLEDAAAPFVVDLLPIERLPRSWRERIKRAGLELR